MSISRIIALPLLVLLSMQLLVSCNLLRPDKRGDLLEHRIFVEVDGRPYEIKRTIQHWKTYSWDASRGDTTGSRSDYGVFGQRIHNNQAIVINFKRTTELKYWQELDDGTLVLSDPQRLKGEFKIYLLDHYKNPQIIEMYDRPKAFDSPHARVKVIKRTRKQISKIPFWIFQGDGKDRYYDYVLKSSGGYFSKQSSKHFESRQYSIMSLTDETIEEITKLRPDIEPKGIYRIKGSYVLDKTTGHYQINGALAHQRAKLSKVINKHSPCIDDSCVTYTGQKIDGDWMMIKGEPLPKKIYSVSDQTQSRVFDLNYTHKFIFGDREIKIKNDPLYSNSFINFDTKEYSTYSYRFYHTREHQKN